MKKEVLLVVGLFLIVLMVGEVNADNYEEIMGTYKNNVDTFGGGNMLSGLDYQIQSDYLPTTTERVRVYWVYNTTCNDSSGFYDSVTLGDLWEPNRTMKLYLSVLEPQYLDFTCNHLDRNHMVFNESYYFNSWNHARFLYGDDYYVGYYSGVEKCQFHYFYDIYCYSFINLDFVSYDNPSKNLRGNIVITAGIDEETREIINTDSIGWLIVEDNKQVFDYNDQRISALESWKETIESWKETITETIIDIWNAVTDNTDRIEVLENQNLSEPNITIQDYWKYLGSSDRKNIVCGIAKNNHLTYLIMEDLDYECTVTYRQTSGGERASCRCSKL